tara:strand:- start:189 stop:911 length:723 start_codon:yes stop_codon:yes gene_type:complete
MPIPNLSDLATLRLAAPTDVNADDNQLEEAHPGLPRPNPSAVPERLPPAEPNHGRLLIGEVDDEIRHNSGSLLAHLQARKAKLVGMKWALLTEMLQWGTGNMQWDIGGGDFGNLLELDASGILKMTLSPQIGFGMDEWELRVASVFPNKGTVDNRVVTREVTLSDVVARGDLGPYQMDRVKWHVIDMDLEALERWSGKIESSAKDRFDKLWFIYQCKEEEDEDSVMDRVEEAYMDTLGAH